ncbi:MAG: radical SAM protein [Elusimicrobiota bacterium]
MNKLKIIKKFAVWQILMVLNRINKHILPKPYNIYFLITSRCNADCKFCSFARSAPERYDEATDEEIKNMLLSFKNYIGCFHINITGGEPLMRKSCLLQIAQFAKENDIILGVTTNGFLIDDKFCEEIMKNNLFFNINVSIDFVGDEHCKNRGINISFEQFKAKLVMLSNYKIKYAATTKLIVKPIIKADNLDHLVKLVEFTKDIKFDHINFQPIFEWTEYSKTLKKDIAISKLKEVLHSLIEYKLKYPDLILNESRHFEMFLPYFTGSIKQDRNICDVGFKNVFIYPDLDITFSCFEKFGNLREQSIDILWKSKEANKIREKVKKCQKVCLATCQLNRTLLEKIQYGYKILFQK